MATRVRSRRPRGRLDSFDFAAAAEDEWQAGEDEETISRRSMMEYADLMPEPGVGPLRFEDFPFQREWYSDEVADAEEVVWAKGAQVGACLDPETRVLTADLRWVRIADLERGDEIVSVDECPAGGKGSARRTRRAVVGNRLHVEKPAVQLTFDDGTTIVASAEHRFLWRRRSVAQMRWEPAGAMRAGDRVRRMTPPPWGEPTYEDGWYGGMIDGEGSLRMRTPENGGTGTECIVTQNLGPVWERAVAYLSDRGYAYGVYERPNEASGLMKGRLKVSRLGEIMRLVGTTRPTRFIDGGCLDGRWWEGRRLPQMNGTAYATVVSVESVGVRALVDLQTSTGTFVAEGLVSHNSGMGVRWCVRQVDQFGDTGLYVMPTDEVVEKFGDERVEPAIEESPYLQSRIRPKWVRNKKLKRIGRAFLHMRGSNSKAGAQSVAAQFLFLDERDLLDQGNLPMIMRRVSGARQLGKTPKVRHAGYPLIPNDGIDLLWQQSDQRVWHVTCGACGDEQPVGWEENVRWLVEGFHEGHSDEAPRGDPMLPLRVMRPGSDAFEDRKAVTSVWRQCRSCEASLEDSAPGKKDGALRSGRWIARRPGTALIGFHVWRGMVPVTDLVTIVQASRATKDIEKEAFAALDLGRPHSTGESSLTDHDLVRAQGFGQEMVQAYYGANPTTMGVDVAGERDLNVWIDEQLPPEVDGVPNPRRALWIGTCSTFEHVARLIELFRVHVVAVDSNPERRMAKTLRATYPGRVVLVEYDHRWLSDPMKLETDEAGQPLKVRVNRTDAIDGMMDSIRQCRSRPVTNPPAGWAAQMKSLHRRTVLNTKGQVEREYVTTGTDGDDYGHAATYALVATELWRAFTRAQMQIAEAAGHHVPDEEMGFKRVRLADYGAADDYRGRE